MLLGNKKRKDTQEKSSRGWNQSRAYRKEIYIYINTGSL
jgi:hypothetical protein